MKRIRWHSTRPGAAAVLALFLAACSHGGAALPKPAAQPSPPVPAPVAAKPAPPTPPAVSPAPPEPAPPPKPAAPEPPKAATPPPKPAAPEKLVSFHFEEADIETVLRAFVDLAGINVILAPGVKTKVTLWVDRVPASQAFAMFQAVLETNSLVAIRSGPIYKIVPVAAAAQQAAPISVGRDDNLGGEQGLVSQVVPLQYLTADDIVKVLQPLAGSGKVQAYRETNSVILTAPASLVKRLMEMVQTLDVPGQQRETQHLYVYYLENAKAPEVATTLSNLFGGSRNERPVASAARQDVPPLPGGAAPPTPPRPGVAALPVAEAAASDLRPIGDVRLASEVRIVADPAVNALIIKATPQDYRVVEQTIKRMDIMPKQVLIEALVAEVTLTDDLNFGLEWFVKAGGFAAQQFFGLGPVPIIKGATLGSQGLSMTFVDGDKFKSFLTTLSKYTKFNTLSSPHVLTQNNREAKIQVGSQVPVVTGTQATVNSLSTGGQNVFQTIQQQDIGRILMIKPHVNEKRQVSLDIQLEVTDVLASSTVNGTPSFSKRAVQTSVLVEDQQSILIGGIIGTTNQDDRTGLPWLSRVPVLGWLFGQTTKNTDRTELFIMLTPHVIADPEEGRQLTESFRNRLDWLEGEMKQLPAAQRQAPADNR